jgi:hypothetical protein
MVRKSRDPLDRYLRAMREAAALWAYRAAYEARYFARTGRHQEVYAFWSEKDDARATRRRLLEYREWLAAAKRAGRYTGGTALRRVLPDGSTEPWDVRDAGEPLPSGAVAPAPGLELARRLFPRWWPRPRVR